MTIDHSEVIATNKPPPTPPGFNKRHRDICKLLLVGTCGTLLANRALPVGVLFAGAAFIVVRQGTVESAKNWKWMIVAVASFVASLVTACLLESEAHVDGNRAYEFKTQLWFYGTFIRTVGGGILALFLFSAFLNEEQITETVKRKQNKSK